MAFGKQLGLMLWKNWILQKRRVCVSVFEIILPVLFAVIFVGLRVVIDTDHINQPTYYELENTIPFDSPPKVPEIGYAPTNPATKKVMSKAKTLQREHGAFNSTFMGFDTENDALDYFKVHSDTLRIIIIFYNVDNTSIALPNVTNFAIRPYTGGSSWLTRLTYPILQTLTPRNGEEEPYYESRGVLYMQRLVGEALVQYRMEEDGGGASSLALRAYKKRMPYPPYIKDGMIFVIQGYLPFFLNLSFILSVVINTKNLVYEKERKLKESMKLMGLKPSVYWLSWFITFLVYIVPAVALYTLLFVLDIVPDKGPVLRETSGFVFFLFLLCYALSVITYCFMISTFVQKGNVAAALSGILHFLSYVPNWFIDPRYEDMGKSEKLGSCLLFNCAMSLGAKVIGIYEGTGEGAQFDNFYKPGTVDDNLSLLECMLMLLVDCAIHLIITWYLDNVRPGEFGVPKPYYFPFMKSYWYGSSTQRVSSSDSRIRDNPDHHFEKDPTNLNSGIQIQNLRKVFGKKTAVAGMSLNMYEGQISVLLGHNGAGKTTTMSMLTGFIPPSSGTAIVNGYEIRENINGVRSSLGLCPQHNILFDTLTVREHLEFFAQLKGAPKSRINGEIITLVQELGIQNKLFDRSVNLSGGQKRKLSVAIALIGGSKVVVLDEPSSGMDPAARRQTWTVLQKHRQGRTMLLTTHYMDEADVLGDRIAIMAEGVVKCSGSSMFLKKLYGTGYHLVVVKKPSCNVDALTALVQSHIATSALECVINMEVTYLLPENESTTFPALFDDLEAKKDKLGISSFGTSATTMEEVFLKVGGDTSAVEVEDEESRASQANTSHINPAFTSMETPPLFVKSRVRAQSQRNGDTMELKAKGQDLMAFNKGFTKKTGLALQFSQIKSLFVKKAILTWRNRTVTLVQLLLPVMFLICGLAIGELTPSSSKAPPLTFDLSRFGKTYVPYTAGSKPMQQDTELARFYSHQFGSRQFLENVTEPLGFDNYTVKRAAELGTSTFNKKMIVGFEGKPFQANESLAAIAHYNGQPYHAEPIAINFMMNAFLQYYTGGAYSLQTSIDPLPKDEESDKIFDLVTGLVTGMIIGIFIVFGMAFLTTLFIFYPIKEKQVGAKHMQIVSGISPLTYWIPTFLWDFISYIVPSLLLVIVFAAYSKSAYIDDNRWLLVILILVMYGWAILPFTYFLSFGFKEPPSGIVGAIMLNLVSGLVTLLAVTILKSSELGTKDVADALDWISIVVFPNYNMAQSFVNMYTNYANLASCLPVQPVCPTFPSPCCSNWCQQSFGFCMRYEESYVSMSPPGIGLNLLFMALHGFLYFTMIMMIEHNVFTRIWYLIRNSPQNNSPDPLNFGNNASMPEDSDVAAERQRLNSSPASVLSSTDPLLLVNLFKSYGNFIAVDHISVGVSEKECFGLLGQNGAGKTTTFKMLTGDVTVTGGNAYLKGYDVCHSIKDVQANMGYCPQFDALLDQMTGRETLTMYSRLRGIPESQIPLVVNKLLNILMLKPHADKLAGNYSGGSKRKLSTAIALVGDPPFIMLDEPSAGMDPEARRQLWNVLSQVRASGRTLVLTSHSMEECDALCTRIAIMVNGSFVCLGSPQHLKNKFGQGYTLVVQLGTLEDGRSAPIEPVINFICQNFPEAKVFDDHQGYVHFQVPDADVSLSKVFSIMESTKVNLNICDYSVHQTTLEQVFLTFTRAQQQPKEDKKRSMMTNICCCCCINCGLMK